MSGPELTSPLFGETPWPPHIKEFRGHQWDAISETLQLFNDHTVVFLEAPTGSGKTLIGEATRRLLGERGIYVCTTKQLQDQFAQDFKYAKVIKGKSNYLTESGKMDQYGNPTPKAKFSAITCADCTYSNTSPECRWCSMKSLCPHQVALDAASNAELAVANTSVLLTDNAYRGQFSNAGFVVMDEADLVEGEIMSQVEVNIGSAMLAKLDIEPPKIKTEEAKTNDWAEWVQDEAIFKTEAYLENMPPPYEAGTVEQIKEHRTIERLLRSLEILASELPHKGWVYDGYDDDNPHKSSVVFKPVYIDRFGPRMVWQHAKRFLLMSATILSPDLMAEDLGVVGRSRGITRSYAKVNVPSTFPLENRPIYIANPPITEMTFKNKRYSYPKMRDGIRKVLELHPDDRILVHTVNYELARYLHGEFSSNSYSSPSRPYITYTASNGKEQALRDYKTSHNSVLFAASMGRGVDLPGDLCRVQIIAKVPFPNLGNKQIAARRKGPGGLLWYRREAIAAIIQMTGRAVRSETDKAVTYILDDQFRSNLMKSSNMFPKYWKESLMTRRIEIG